VLALSGQLAEGLRAQGAPVLTPERDTHRSGIVSAQRPDAERWHAAALAAGIVHSPRGEGTLRFSPHLYNTEDDIKQVLHAWATL